MAVIDEVTAAYEKERVNQDFLDTLDKLQANYAGRPSPLYETTRLGEHAGSARIFLKREDLNHTGSHKINNVLGQALLARRMGKTRVIAETGAGQHGVATATACALLGLDCIVYMGAVDTARQALNVARMRLLGAEVVSVETGSQTLKDAINEAFRDWVTNADNTYYCFGTAAGPHPFPTMVRDFQRIIGLETRVQIQAQAGRLPDAVDGVRRRRIQRDRRSSIPSSTTPVCGWWDTRRPAMVSRPAGTRRHSPAVLRAHSRDRSPTCCRTRTARPSNPIRSQRVWIIRGGPRTRLAQGDRTCRVPAHHRCRGDGRVRPAVPRRRHHPGHRIRACGGRRPEVGRRIGKGRGHCGEPVGPRRQGRRDSSEVVRLLDKRPGSSSMMTVEQSETSRLGPAFDSCREDNRAALIGYLPTGYPDVPTSHGRYDRPGRIWLRHRRSRRAVFGSGHGRPHHPAATEAALRGGVRVRDTLAAVEAISKAGGRAVVMTYWNPVLRYGVDAFARDLAAAGGHGLITPDLIPDEAHQWLAASEEHRLDRIFLVAPSSTPERLVTTVEASRGFVYAASTMGVTGARDAVSRCRT